MDEIEQLRKDIKKLKSDSILIQLILVISLFLGGLSFYLSTKLIEMHNSDFVKMTHKSVSK